MQVIKQSTQRISRQISQIKLDSLAPCKCMQTPANTRQVPAPRAHAKTCFNPIGLKFFLLFHSVAGGFDSPRTLYLRCSKYSPLVKACG
ncbi:unnamed protein product [Colias eurytheme]|nr:unnamed protein product [Colias eurytheme]